MSSAASADGAAPLADRVALVTGGTAGLGLATARRLLEAGAAVVVTGRDPERGRAAAETLSGLGPARFVRADATSPDDADAAVAVAEDAFGRLDVLVASAGIGVVCSLLETSQEDWRAILDTNVSGCLYAAQSAMRAMRRAGRQGSVVLIASDAGVVGERSIGAYSVSKAAVVMMAKVLALDGAAHGIRVNCLCPGYVEPGMLQFPDRTTSPDGEAGPGYVDPPVPPLGRYGQADDIAQAVLYLVGDGAAFMTGSVVLADGGATAGLP